MCHPMKIPNKTHNYYLVCKPYLDSLCIIDTESNNEKDNNYSEAAFVRFYIEFHKSFAVH